MSLASRKKGKYALAGMTTCCLRKIPDVRKFCILKPRLGHDSATDDISAATYVFNFG